jgi:hypothetical protein
VLEKARRLYSHKSCVRYIEDSTTGATLARAGHTHEAVSWIETTCEAMRSGGLLRHLVSQAIAAVSSFSSAAIDLCFIFPVNSADSL